MELKVTPYQQPDPINFNYEEMKAELAEKIHVYETIVYDDDQIKQAKADRANLNKLKKALNDERIRREKEYMQPFNDFKNKINDIIQIIDKPCAIIDARVKEYENKVKQEKNNAIIEYFEAYESKPSWLNLTAIFDNTWLNASTNMSKVKAEIDEAIEKTNKDIDTIKTLPEFSFEAMEVYKQTLDLGKAIQEGQRLADIQRRKEEQAKAEAERKAAEAAAKTEPAPDFMNPPVDEIITEEPKQWVMFNAFLTVTQAKKLKAFFDAEGIEFKAI